MKINIKGIITFSKLLSVHSDIFLTKSVIHKNRFYLNYINLKIIFFYALNKIRLCN